MDPEHRFNFWLLLAGLCGEGLILGIPYFFDMTHLAASFIIFGGSFGLLLCLLFAVRSVRNRYGDERSTRTTAQDIPHPSNSSVGFEVSGRDNTFRDIESVGFDKGFVLTRSAERNALYSVDAYRRTDDLTDRRKLADTLVNIQMKARATNEADAGGDRHSLLSSPEIETLLNHLAYDLNVERRWRKYKGLTENYWITKEQTRRVMASSLGNPSPSDEEKELVAFLSDLDNKQKEAYANLLEYLKSS